MGDCSSSQEQNCHRLQMGIQNKVHVDGTVERYKGRLMAKGYTDKYQF